jgi:xanthine dehydrogenase YagR molybdenum-binding subunit
MHFDKPAGSNPIDRLKVVGQPVSRIDGPLKTTGTATYAYENRDIGGKPAYGFVLGAAIGKGRISSIDESRARAAPGVLAS